MNRLLASFRTRTIHWQADQSKFKETQQTFLGIWPTEYTIFDAGPLLPFSVDASLLRHDLKLVRFAAQQVLLTAAIPVEG
jgi:hypothetical protein